MTPTLELVITVHVVLKWISGKLTLRILKLPHILVLLKDNTDVKVPNVVIMHLVIDIMEFVTKMDVISTHTD